MKTVTTPDAMQRLSLRRVGFVPTMGALHQGHLSLIERAKRENDRVVVSIFVNPLQFGPKEDLSKYPRPFAKDAAMCRKAGVDVLYHPTVEAMYPNGSMTRIEVAGLSETLEGAHRPGHFSGVATVVAKLFAAVQPERAYFGEKDYQQLQVIKQMVRDLDLPVKVLRCPTVREADGLALSSRNVYLSERDRARASLLPQGLMAAVWSFRDGNRSVAKARSAALERIRRIPGVRIDYVEIRHPETLAPVRRLEKGSRILAAIRVGKTRLIDNMEIA